MQPQTPLTPQAPLPSANPTVTPNYDFIVNPVAPKKAGPKLPGGGSILGRIVIILVVIFVLLIIFVVVKGALTKPSASLELVGVAQDQQAIIAIATAASVQPGVSTKTLNSAVTSQLSVKSDQAILIGYLNKHNVTVKTPQLNTKVSASTTTQLTNAASAGQYDTTYKSVMQSLLATYSSDLNKTYNSATSKVTRELLKSDFENAQLLIKQLD